VIVDSAVWIDSLRGTRNRGVAALGHALRTKQRISMTPVVLQEVLQGARSMEQFESWAARFGSIPMLSPPDLASTLREAARLYVRCRSAGVTPRSGNDCHIARVAIEFDVPVLTSDRDFALIARVEPTLRLALIEDRQ